MTDQLNEQQQQAVHEIDGAVLVLAGAGSGKTRVLTNRIEYMVTECGIKPWNILAITFTNKAANEMKTRLERRVPSADRMWISTIHSMCARILRQEANLLGYTGNFSVYTDSDTDKILKRLCSEKFPDDDTMKKSVGYHVSRRKNENLTYEEYEEQNSFEKNITEIVEIMREYDARLKRANAMDFDDLFYELYQLFVRHPDVLEKYQDKFRYISIDEFQDTNKIQYDIFRLLSKKYGNLFVVGDDDQSIYGWRGADVRNLLDFRKDFPQAHIFKLEQNYRSSKKILNAANAIISRNPERYEKKLWTENSEGVRIETYSAYNETEEAYFVVQQIENLKRYNGMKYSDFAILMRVNALSRTFEQQCMTYGIPLKVYGGFKFYDRKEIKDLIAYMNLLVNPQDDEAFARILNVPKRGLGESTLQKLREFAAAKNTSLFKILYDESCLALFTKSIRGKLEDFGRIFTDVQEKQLNSSLSEFTEYLIRRSGLKSGLTDSDEDLNRAMNMDEFVQSVREFEEANEGADLGFFLQSTALMTDVETADKNNATDCVTLATIHAAKGLEFKTVFIVGLDESIFPLSRALFDDFEMSEERRLMYVAITRAMERLYLTRTKSRFLYGERKDMYASRFFREVEEMTRAEKAPELKPKVDVGIKTEAKTIEKLRPGTKVMHKTFGKGIVLTNRDGMGDIAFENVGVKTLSFKFAPLEIIET